MAGVFLTLNVGNDSLFHLFLMIPLNLYHNSAMHNTIYKKIPKYIFFDKYQRIHDQCNVSAMSYK